MKFLHWGILMLLVLVVPFLLGMLPTSYVKKLHRTPAFIFVCGWLVMFSSFEVVAIPFILLEKKYSTLILVYSMVILVLLVISCMLGKDLFLELWGKYNLKAIISRIRMKPEKILAFIGWLLFWCGVAAQVYMAIFYEYYDGDDSYYLAVPVLSEKYNTMYLRDTYTGYNYDLDLRHALSPTPIFIGWLSRLSQIHSTIIAHSVLSVVWLLLMYFVFMEMSKYLFRKNKQYRPWFMCMLVLWYTFGNVTISTAETFIMTRTWQGKGLLAGVILPCIFLSYFMFAQKDVTLGTWMFFSFAVVSSIFATSVSFMLVSTMSVLALILIKIYKRNATRRSLCRK